LLEILLLISKEEINKNLNYDDIKRELIISNNAKEGLINLKML
jgi:hypothetical protein